ncbi:hypothetical protein H4R33_001812 [Dimargaris cristalligena]|nr:hypothetical protein H4R33_001812 [Dimargaris cristalligena]
MFKLTYFLLALPAIGSLTPTLLGSPVPDRANMPLLLPIDKPQPYFIDDLGNIQLTEEADAEDRRRPGGAGLIYLPTDDNGNTPAGGAEPILIPTDDNDDTPALQLLQDNVIIALYIRQSIQEAHGGPPEGPIGDVLDEIRDADVITEAMQTRFWDSVRQPGLISEYSGDFCSFAIELPPLKTKLLVYDYLFGNEISYNLGTMEGGKAVATTTLKHSVLPGLLRLGRPNMASYLSLFSDYINQVADLPISPAAAAADMPSASQQRRWFALAWQAQLNGSVKVLAIRGDNASLGRLADVGWLNHLTPLETFATAMWAFWFNLPASARTFMDRVADPSHLTPSLRSLHPRLYTWCQLEAGAASEASRIQILEEMASSFNSGYFFNEYPQASRFLNLTIEESQEAILDAIETQLTFTLPIYEE